MPNSIPETEAAKRIAEGLPGLALAGRAVGLANHRQMLADHRQRVRDAHRMQARAAGMEDLATDPEADEMGDIVICGDNCFNVKPQQQPTPTTPASASPAGGTDAPAAASATTPLWKQAAALAAIVAGVGGSAGLAAWLTSHAAEQPAAAVQQPAVNPPGYGVQVEKQSAANQP